jgi:predicted flap endonuclease-1-like 5' DNA nuclease
MWPNVSSTFTDRLFNSSASFAPVLSAQEGKVEVIEAMVKQALRTQSQWSDAVTDRIVSAPGLPSPIADAARQMHSVTENVLQFQTQLWDGWFRMLKGADPLGANPLSVPAVDIPSESPTAAPTEEAAVEAVEAALEAPPTRADDDLRAISGVGPVLAEKLRAEGITSYQQVASWSDDDVARIESTIIPARFAGRIARDGWIAQAKKLHQEKHGPSA